MSQLDIVRLAFIAVIVIGVIVVWVVNEIT